MGRLTSEAWRNFDPWECCGQDKYCQRGCHDPGGCTKGCIVPRLYARLGAYEDTARTPEEVIALCKLFDYALKESKTLTEQLDLLEHIHALAEAGRAGRLVVLPCKVGDTVWFKTYGYNGRTCVGIQPHKVIGNKVLITTAGCLVPTDLPLSGFEKDWFLTREEAEKALEAKQDG